ncbi:MAG: hypothetical protein QME21_17475 [Anaerolineales bacterium]|nr:hypothetical protein [Anaerolineales bacterium]
METSKTPEKRLTALEEQARMRTSAQRFDLTDLFQRAWGEAEPFVVYLNTDGLRNLKLIWGE